MSKVTVLPDGSAFAVVELPLPADHSSTVPGDNVAPMPFRVGTGEEGIIIKGGREGLAEIIRAVGRYAYRASTLNGTDSSLDPDALVQNLVVGFLGYWTGNGLSRLDGEDEAPRLGVALVEAII